MPRPGFGNISFSLLTEYDQVVAGNELPLSDAYYRLQSAAIIDDVNGDGADDIVALAHYITSDGVVGRLISGLDGSVLAEFEPLGYPQDSVVPFPDVSGSFAGAHVVGIGDADGDGAGDFVIADPYRDAYALIGGQWTVLERDTGVVMRVSGGALLDDSAKPEATQVVYGTADGSNFGRGIAAIGDIDGDGVSEIAVSAPWETGPEGAGFGDPGRWRGSVTVLSGDTFRELYRIDGAIHGPLPRDMIDGDRRGYHIAGVGDTDGDGIPDFAISDPTMRNPDHFGDRDAARGVVDVFSGADGSLIDSYFNQIRALGSYGEGLAGLDDVDGDGIPDIAVGMPDMDFFTGGVTLDDAGAISVRSGADLALNAGVMEGDPEPDSGGHFGEAIASLPDLTGDGIGEIAVAAPGAGRVTIYSAGREMRVLGHYDTGMGAYSVTDPVLGTLLGGMDGALQTGDLDGDGEAELLLLGSRGDGQDAVAFDIAPAASLPERPVYSTDGDPVRLSETVFITDADATFPDFFGGISLAITRAGDANPDDRFWIDTPGPEYGYTVSGDGTYVTHERPTLAGNNYADLTIEPGRIILSFRDAASREGPAPTDSVVADILRSIVYSNAGDTPPDSVDLAWTVADDDSATTITQTVDILDPGGGTPPPPPGGGTPVALTLEPTAPVVVTEGTGDSTDPAYTPSELVWTLTLSEPTPTDITVTWDMVAGGSGAALADGSDFLDPASGTLTIPSGATGAQLSLRVDGDALLEDDESVIASFLATPADPRAATITVAPPPEPMIENDDGGDTGGGGGGGGGGTTARTVSLSASVQDVEEGDSGMRRTSVEIALSGPVAAPVGIDWVAGGLADANDFIAGTALSGRVEIAPGDTVATLDFNVSGDRLVEGDETLTVSITSIDAPDGAIAGLPGAAASITIRNDDDAQVSIGDASVDEGDLAGPAGAREMIFPVTLSDPVDAPVAIDWEVQHGDTEPADFTADTDLSGQVTIPAGATAGSISLDVQGDRDVEGDERFDVVITGIAAPADVTEGEDGAGLIRDDDADDFVLTLVTPDRTVQEGTGIDTPLPFEIALAAAGTRGQQPVTVDQDVRVPWIIIPGARGLPGTDRADFAGDFEYSGIAVIPEGQSSTTIDLTIAGDSIAEMNEGFTLLLNQAIGSEGRLIPQEDVQARTTITDDDGTTVWIEAKKRAMVEGAPNRPLQGSEGAELYEFVIHRSGDISGTTTADWAVSTTPDEPRIGVFLTGDLGRYRDQGTVLVEFENATEAQTFAREALGDATIRKSLSLSFVEKVDDLGALFDTFPEIPEKITLLNLEAAIANGDLPPELVSDSGRYTAGPLSFDYDYNVVPEIEVSLEGAQYGELLLEVTQRGNLVLPAFVEAGESFSISTEDLGTLTRYQTDGVKIDGLTLDALLRSTGPNGISELRLTDLLGTQELLYIEEAFALPPFDERIPLAELDADGASVSANDLLSKLVPVDVADQLPSVDVNFNLPQIQPFTGANDGVVIEKRDTPLVTVSTGILQYLPFINKVADLVNREFTLGDLEEKLKERQDNGEDSDSIGLDRIGELSVSLTTLDWTIDLGLGLQMELSITPTFTEVEMTVEGEADDVLPGPRTFGEEAISLNFDAPDDGTSILTGEAVFTKGAEIEMTLRLGGVGTSTWTALSAEIEGKFSDMLQGAASALGLTLPEIEWSYEALPEAVDIGRLPGRFDSFTFTGTTTVEFTPVSVPFEIPTYDSANVDLAGRVTFGPLETEKRVIRPVLPDTEFEPDVEIEARLVAADNPDGGVVQIGRDRDITRLYDDEFDDTQILLSLGVTEFIDNGTTPEEFLAYLRSVGFRIIGEPHLMTGDGLGYDFQAAGEFVALRATDGTPFELQLRFEPAAGSDIATATTAIALKVENTRLSYSASEPDILRIDGEVHALIPYEVQDHGDLRLQFDGTRLMLVTVAGDFLDVSPRDRYLDLSVTPAPFRSGAIEGLLGNYDGDINNDLALADGTPLGTNPDFATLYGDFAEAWRVTDATTLFDYPDSLTTGDFTDRSRPAGLLSLDAFPDDVVAEAEALVDSYGIESAQYREWALFDFLITGNEEYIESLARLDAQKDDPRAVASVADAPSIPAGIGIRAVVPEVDESLGGSVPAAFELYRIGGADTEVTVSYQLGGDIEGDDLPAVAPLAGAVTLFSGQQSAAITVPFANDSVAEEDETLAVTLTDAGALPIVAGGAEVVIRDDDGPMPETLSLKSVTQIVNEASGGEAVFLLTREGDATAMRDFAVSLDTGADAANAADIGALAGPIRLASGAERLLLRIPVVDDLREEGTETLRLRLEDAGTVLTAQAEIADDDIAPRLSGERVRTGAERTIDIRVLANDIAGTLPIAPETVSITAQPGFGSVAVDPLSGMVTYTPDAGRFGTDRFEYVAADAAGRQGTPAEVTVEVVPPTRAQTGLSAQDDAAETLAGDPAVLDLFANDTGAALALAALEQPARGSVTRLGDGQVRFDPGNAFNTVGPAGEIVQFRYTVTDGAASAEATVRIGVTYENSAPDGMALSRQTVPEDLPSGGRIAEIEVYDPNSGDVHDLKLIDDNEGLVRLEGNDLMLSEDRAFDAERMPYIDVEVEATDAGGLSLRERLDFNIAEAPNPDPILGTPESDRLAGTAGRDTILAYAGDDVVQPGFGPDTVALGPGRDHLEGTLLELSRDIVMDFGLDDTIILRETALTREQIDWLPHSGTLRFSGDRSTPLDVDAASFFTLMGDFGSGDFMAVQDSASTLVTFEPFLPALAEGQTINPSLINGIVNQPFLQGDGGTNFAVTLKDMGYAAYNNVLGVYEIDASGNVLDPRILFSNANADKTASTLIEDVNAGHKLGFFLVQNAADWAMALEPDDVLSFVTGSGTLGNLADNADVKLAVNGTTTDEIVFHSFDERLNTDGVQHTLSGVEPGGKAIRIGFEDLTGGGDLDYEDVVFTVEAVDII